MEKASSNYSLSFCLDSFWSNFPSPLVNETQLRLLKEKSHFFPPVLRIGIECRMNNDAQVDLQQCLRRDEDDLTYLLDWLRHQSVENDDEWEALLGFFTKWTDPIIGYHKDISEIFFEMDVLPGKRRVPLLFFSLPEENTHYSNDFLVKVLGETLGRECVFYPILQRCFESCPENAMVFFAGLPFSRQIDAIRINIKNLYSNQVIPFLKEIGYNHLTADLEYWINFTYSLSDRIRLCIDLGKFVFPKIGFECFWNDESNVEAPMKWDNEPEMETPLGFFLNQLVKQNICLKEKAEAVLSWNKEIFPQPSLNWPEHLWVQSLNRPSNEFTFLKQKVSHLKLSIDPLKGPELKSYLGYGNLWLKIKAREKIDTFKRELLSNPPKEAIIKGLEFIINSQRQSGFWVDFQLPPGKSDEWVTAYVGYHLSFFDDSRIADSLKRAWQVLKTRYRPGAGWAYNAWNPADADSTIWAYLLSTRIHSIEHVEIYNLLRLYRLPEGGVTTYLEKDKAAMARSTNLAGDASFTGWQGLHLCVTAAYALSGDSQALNTILDNLREDGSVKAYWWATDEYATALATEAMALNPVGNRERINKAVAWALKRLAVNLESPDSSAFNISLLIRILLISPAQETVRESIDKGIEYLLTSQLENGSWMPSSNLYVPMPGTVKPEEIDREWVVNDQNAIFTSITVLTTLKRLIMMNPEPFVCDP